MTTAYETVIGLEVHAQLLTQSKLFCGCSTAFGAAPNAHTCEVCLGMPGVLPVLNGHAVELAVRAALGLGCRVQPVSEWSRKNYFYPDLPKGYQITQFERPIALGGKLAIELDGQTIEAGITRIHMEEDAGKSVHDEALAGARSYVDFNRGGTPLVEIVGEPDLRSSEAAAAYLKALRQVLRYLGVCDGNMEEGSLRCDCNVSVRPKGAAKLGTRVELKNINSFRFVQQAIDYEVSRQIELVEGGGQVTQETRLWDAHAQETRSMRSKEEAHDYRYFPDPDLPNLVLAEGFVAQVQARLPELPAAKLQRYTATLQLSEYDSKVLIEDAEIAGFFEQALAAHDNPKGVANWVINELLRELRGRALSEVPVTPASLGELVALIDDGTISGKIAKQVFGHMLQEGGTPKRIVANKGLVQVSDTSTLEPIIDALLADHADTVQKIREGNGKLLGFLVGQVMQKTQGKANPKMVNELLRKKIG